jgi:hypothetical protein
MKREYLTGIIFSFLLVIIHYSREYLGLSTWDVALKPGNIELINLPSSIIFHLNDRHFYLNLLSFVILTSFHKKSIYHSLFIVFVCSWLGNLYAVLYGNLMVLGMSGGLVGLAMYVVCYQRHSLGRLYALIYLGSIIYLYIIKENNISHLSHFAGFLVAITLLILNLFSDRKQNIKETTNSPES